MGELLPPALRGQGERETVSGSLQLPPDILLAGPARLHRQGMGNGQAAPGTPAPMLQSRPTLGSAERQCVGAESDTLCLPDCVSVSAAAHQPGSLPRQIPGRSRVPGIGTPRLSRCALATGTPTRQAFSDRPRGPRACPSACATGDVCGPGVHPGRLRSIQTTRTYS